MSNRTTLTFMEFAPLSQRTANRKLDKVSELRTIVLGLYGEAGEVCDLLKKAWGHGHILDTKKLAEELGDVAWYVAAAWFYAGQPVVSAWAEQLPGYDGVDLPFELQRQINSLAACFDVTHPSINGHTWTGLVNQVSAKAALEGCVRVLSRLASQYGYDIQHIFYLNIEKLKARYPEGFDNERSINRDVQAEGKRLIDLDWGVEPEPLKVVDDRPVPVFRSFAHQPDNAACPCNDCRYGREG